MTFLDDFSCMKKIKKPDLNAPRFRAKRKSILTKDKFSLFKEKYPEHHTATLKQFKEIRIVGY